MLTTEASGQYAEPQLRYRAAKQTKLVTSMTAGYLRWLAHLHRNLNLFGLAQDLSVCAHDNASAHYATASGLHVVHWPIINVGSQTVGATAFTSKQSITPWVAVNHAKHRCVLSILDSTPDDATVLLIDGDVTLFRNPLHALPPRDTADIAILDDHGNTNTLRAANGGFVLLRASRHTRAWYSLFVRSLARHSRSNDQDVLNAMLDDLEVLNAAPSSRRLVTVNIVCEAPDACRAREAASITERELIRQGKRKHRHPETIGQLRKDLQGMAVEATPSRRLALRVVLLNQLLFANGFRFFEKQAKPDVAAVVALHHNWISGDDTKHARAAEYGTLVDSDNETLARFRRRARQKIAALPRWRPPRGLRTRL